jgi:hypothetical protein
VADAQRLHRSRAELSKIFLLLEAEALKELKVAHLLRAWHGRGYDPYSRNRR